MTVCPSCGAEDSLEQSVVVSYDTVRPVDVEWKGDKLKIAFGSADGAGALPEIEQADEIRCYRCEETWENEKAFKGWCLRPQEYRCGSCDWWGFNDWQHGIERPNCEGEVRRLELERVA